MKKKNILIAITCLAIAFSCAKKAETDSKEIAEEQNEQKFDDSDAERDTEFAVEAADGGMLEVKLGELAQSNGLSPEIKKFGRQMVDDHSKANAELQTLAQEKSISLPGTLSEKNQKTYDDLAKKTGAEFDKAYCEFMVKDHKDDIDAFKKEAEKGNDMGIKAWANDKLPTLEHHLMMAEQADKALSKR